jgi:nitroreductase
MDVFEAMRRRRMHRRFTGEPVSEEALAQLVRAATLAPMAATSS